MIDFKNCTEEEMWKYVASELAADDVDVVLVGGAVVSIYSEGAYKSGDLDFVLNDFSRTQLDKTLKRIGFRKKGRFYTHPECSHLFLEFAEFPVSIGNDTNITPEEINHNQQIIKIYSPTDCVRDRLAGYMYFKSRDNLDQAVLVSKRHPVNLDKIKKWCEQENQNEIFEEFVKLLSEKIKT